MKLHLGVVDVAYSDDLGGSTTGEVAEILESNYHVMRIFFEDNEEFIGNALVEAMAGAIESLAQGKIVNVFSREASTRLGERVLSGTSFTDKIDERFRDFLDAGEATKISRQMVSAAEAGVSHRKKKPFARENPARPAFVDTGLYSASFRAWVD